MGRVTALLSGLAVVVLTTWLFVNAHVDHVLTTRIENGLQTLLLLEAEYGRQLAQARLGLLPNYDSLSGLERQKAALLKRQRALMLDHAGRDAAPMAAMLAAIEPRLAQQRRLRYRFQEANSVQKNSVAYLLAASTADAAMATRGLPDLARRSLTEALEGLRDAALRFGLSGDAADEGAVRAWVARVRELSQLPVVRDREALQLMARHALVLVEQQHRVEQLSHALLEHSLSPALAELLQIQRRHVAGLANRAYLFRTLLYAVTVVLLFYVAAVVLRLRTTAQALSDNNRALARAMAERRAAEARDREHLEQLAHIGRLNVVGEMTAQLAHELNQPLCAISTYCQGALRMLRTGEPDPDRLGHTLEQARDQAQRASEIIRRVRELVRREPSHRAHADINAVVRAAVSLVRPDLHTRGASLILRLAPQLPSVAADTIQIEQVILNLLRNALDAALGSDGSGDGVIEVETDSPSSGAVRVCVRDRGRGLEPEALERVFEPFETSKADGLGLGLSISRTIVEHHGGRIWAEQPEGGGTRFCFTLPAGQGGTANA